MAKKKPLVWEENEKGFRKKFTAAVRKKSKFIIAGGGIFAIVAVVFLVSVGPQLDNDGVGPQPNQPPVASFSFSPSSSLILLNESVQFTDASADSDGVIASWLWDFGDGTNSTEQNPTHQYAEAGAYTITLTVTDDREAADNVSQIVTVVGPSRVSIEFVDEKPQLRVNGEQFVVKGAAYAPTPVGQSAAAGYNWWDESGTYTNDFPMLEQMGANTIRTYGSDATREALDAAYANGIYVIMGHWVNYYLDLSNESNRQSQKEEFLELVRAWKNHPAVLMWAFGNEVEHRYEASGTGRNVRDWYTLLQETCEAIKAEDNMHLTMYPHIDSLGSGGVGDSSVKADDQSLSALDVWGLNCYRGSSFGSFFDEYTNRSTKPFIMTEFGCDAWDGRTGVEDQSTQANYVRSQWLEIESNLSPASSCLGGTVFEWCDEWWKAGTPSSHTKTAQWQNGSYTDPNMNEEWWGITASSPGTYEKTPREAYYTLQELWTGTTTPDFTLSVSPASGTVQAGGSAQATVQVSARGGYAESVSLSASGEPSGVTVDLSPTSGTPSFSSTMTINVGATAAQGSYTITIAGTGADTKTHTSTYSLTIGTVSTQAYVVYNDAGFPSGSEVWTWSGADWGLPPGEFDSGYTGESPPEGSKCFRTKSGSGSGNYAGWGVFLIYPSHHTVDLSSYSSLKFWVKTPANLKVEIEAPEGATQTKWIIAYGWDSPNIWQEIIIPASDFTNLNQVYCPLKVTITTSGTFYIDNVRWV